MMMATIKIATKTEENAKVVAIVSTIADVEEDMIPQNWMKKEAGKDLDEKKLTIKIQLAASSSAVYS